MKPGRTDVAIVGSGFAGSLLARILTRLDYHVTLIEKERHPRFAIGESSTPLGNLCLERLSRRYDLPDLYELAAHGRWTESHPGLERGLKRGFTFYRHHPHEAYANSPRNEARLLVAASPNDRVADNHWLRADVDAFFVEKAVEEGVRYLDRTRITEVRVKADGVSLSGQRLDEAVDVRARLVVDAGGPGGFLARHLDLGSALHRVATHSSVVFSHFEGVRPFMDVALEAGASMEHGPYADDRAAVHHMLDEGWMYVLRFDDGRVSAGLLTATGGGRAGGGLGGPAGSGSFEAEPDPATEPEKVWRAVLDRYPSLAEQFADAEPLFPMRGQARLQHRVASAVGERWLLLPHAYAFTDPLFSTGIAWSLLGIERIARLFEEARDTPERLPTEAGLRRYEAMLSAEADQVDRLIHGAYLALPDFELMTLHSMLYFAAVSYAESLQRLAPDGEEAWRGFMGVGDPELEPLVAESVERVARLTGGGRHAAADEDRRAYASWLGDAIAPRDVAGLLDPARRNLYPVDLDVLVERATLLGLTRKQVRERLPVLRGGV